MMSSRALKSRFLGIWDIIFRNVFLLINGIIFAVAILLTWFGDKQAGIFLVLITVLNMIIAIIQETHAWLVLEKLQLSAAPIIIRLNELNKETIITTNEINAKDRLKLKIGDQVPCDGHLVSSHGFEVNEALITGESRAFLEKPGDEVMAGSIVTSGSGIMEADKIFAESRIAQMTKSIKKYSLSLSPIQSSLVMIIKYISYALLIIITFVVGRGLFVHESTVNIIQNIGALTSALLPQGMVFITTLLFSYGAINLYRSNILLQEVNATEKIGRIKNLCIDKTGTLTDNNLVVEHMYLAEGVSKEIAEGLVSAYVKGTGDSSKTMQAIEENVRGVYAGTVVDELSFSSTRQYGAVHIKDSSSEGVIFVGAPDIFLAYIVNENEREWLQKYINTEGKVGKRLICFTRSDSTSLPHDFEGIKLSVICVFVLDNNLREGVTDTINFFQTRGVSIRVISGDNLETVQAVSFVANIKNTDAAITGPEMENWTPTQFLENVHKYTIFARVKPEQKEKIIEALKADGFTAMIGDGANDALAIKKADLGIAMFDGAQATRQIASIVLTKNSFSDLPRGVRLADTIIENIEICASIFFYQVFLAFFFFIILVGLGHVFPFTPLNITFINYFTVGMPGVLIFYWIVRPTHTKILKTEKSFLRRVLPFPLISAVPASFLALLAYFESLEHVNLHGPTSLVVLSFIIAGIIFFMTAPRVYTGSTTGTQKREFALLIIAEIVIILTLFRIPLLALFYDIKAPSLRSFIEILPWVCAYVAVQYGLTRLFFTKNTPQLAAANN